LFGELDEKHWGVCSFFRLCERALCTYRRSAAPGIWATNAVRHGTPWEVPCTCFVFSNPHNCPASSVVLRFWSCPGGLQVGSEIWQNLDWDWSPSGFFWLPPPPWAAVAGRTPSNEMWMHSANCHINRLRKKGGQDSKHSGFQDRCSSVASGIDAG